MMSDTDTDKASKYATIRIPRSCFSLLEQLGERDVRRPPQEVEYLALEEAKRRGLLEESIPEPSGPGDEAGEL